MSNIKKPMQGVRIWKNDKNKFVIFELHYSADPAKRAEIFRESVKSGLPLQKFLQEYEIQWDTYEGMPVYRDYNRQIHHLEIPPEPERGLPLLIGVDNGLTPAAIICQLQDEALVVLKELVEFNMGAKRFAQVVKNYISVNLPIWSSLSNVQVHMDPSGFFRNDTDEGSCKLDFINAGFKDVQPGPIAPAIRKEGVEHFLTRTTRKGASFQICEDTAPMAVKGFEGGYHYPKNAIEREDDLKPVKNEFSHVHDGLQYVACAAAGILKTQRRYKSVPTPSYNPQRT